MNIKHYIGYVCITISSILIGMDAPEHLALHLIKKSNISINFDDHETAFKQLTKNNACLLKNLVAEEQKGKYCPELYKAIQAVDKVYHSGSTNFFNKIKNIEVISFLNSISKKSTGYNKLISLLNEDIYIGNILLKCRKKMVKNRYIANTYGSCEPYHDRIITPLHYVLAKVNNGLWSELKGIEYCTLLLSCQANPNAKDDFGNTPMHHASTPRLVELLYLHGAEINTKGYCSRTPLCNNIRLCNWPVVECLLGYLADPNEKDDEDNW